MSETQVHWLTQEAHDRLAAELAEREGATRAEITKRIEAARAEGDLKENGGYHAAREEQGKNEGRIRELKHKLQHARIGAPQAAEDEVAVGRLVGLRFDGDDEVETYLVGAREEAALASVEVLSPSSPLGSALLGRRVGDRVGYEAPNGRQLQVDVVTVAPYGA